MNNNKRVIKMKIKLNFRILKIKTINLNKKI